MRELRWLFLTAWIVLPACGDDGGEPQDSTGSGTGSTTGSTTQTSAPGSTSDTPTVGGTSSTTDNGSESTTTGGGTSSTGGATGSTGLADTGSTGEIGTTGAADCHPLIVEVLYDAVDDDDQLQWVKLYNPCAFDVQLGDWTIGYGGESYAAPRLKPLSGTMGAGQCYIVGGPTATQANGNPDFDLADDFSPGLDTAQTAGGGVALFDLPEADVDATTVPIDAVVYGPNNDNGLIDETGRPVATPHVGNPRLDSGGSIRRTGEGSDWEIAAVPSPEVCPPF